MGTRRSPLAVTQSTWVARRIERAAAARGLRVRVDLVEVTTHGDVSSAPLTSFGGVGVFVSRLRTAVLAGEVDLAVHSLKDLPGAPEPGLALAAVPVREDPRDVLVARDGLDLAGLPDGARIGTGSPRRAAQLRAVDPRHVVVDLRGNVDSRITAVRDGSLDAVVLAGAGLARLGRWDEATHVFDHDVMVPAPGQGALAVECRAEDADLVDLLGGVDDPDTREAVIAERTLMTTLEAGCAAPLGAHAEVSDGRVQLLAAVVAHDGSESLRSRATAPVGEAAALGRRLAARMLREGAGSLLAGASSARAPDGAVLAATIPTPPREGDL